MDDLEFVQRCVKGDTQAWHEFVDKYSRLIYNYIHSVLKLKGKAVSSSDAVDDLFQEIFVSLRENNFRKLSTFKAKNGASLASWLRQVVINFTLDYLRKIRPAISLDEEITEEFSLEDILPAENQSVKDLLVIEERLIPLKECIEILDMEDKYFLELHFNQGIDLEDLKAVLKVSRGAVDMRKSRLIGRLRDCFRGKGFGLDF